MERIVATGRRGRTTPWSGFLTATIAIAIVGTNVTETRCETRQWKVGQGGLSWRSQSLVSSAVDFGASGAIQMVSFAAEENIISQLDWVEEFPRDFVGEKAEGRVWDNIPLKMPNKPIVDGVDTTSTEDRFKKTEIDHSGTTFFFDLGTRFPAERIRFFPRQTGEDSEGFAFREDHVRSYQIDVSDGLTYDGNLPVYALLKQVEFTADSVQEIFFPLQMLRFIRLIVTSPSPFEIAEFQLFGSGFAPKSRYLSQVIDLGDAANYHRIEWSLGQLNQVGDSLVVVDDAQAGITVRMRTGTDDSPLVHYRYTNPFTGEREEVSEAEYDQVDVSSRGPIEDDRVNWSGWSSPLDTSGQAIDVPGPRRYFQFQITMDSRSILDGIRIASLAVERPVCRPGLACHCCSWRRPCWWGMPGS